MDGARARRNTRQRLGQLRHRLAAAEQKLTDTRATLRLAERRFDVAGQQVAGAEDALETARAERDEARRQRYAARQAHNRASAAVDRLNRQVRELRERLDRMPHLTAARHRAAITYAAVLAPPRRPWRICRYRMVLPRAQGGYVEHMSESSRRPSQQDGILRARLCGTAMHHAKWRDLTEQETAAAVAALRELAAGRADLLAEQAGLLIGAGESTLREPLNRCAAQVLIAAGADPALVPRWIEEGRRRGRARNATP